MSVLDDLQGLPPATRMGPLPMCCRALSQMEPDEAAAVHEQIVNVGPQWRTDRQMEALFSKWGYRVSHSSIRHHRNEGHRFPGE